MVPEWLIAAIGVAELLGLLLVSWVWEQARLNLVAVTDPTLRRFAFRRLRRESILWVVQAASFVAYAVAVLAAQPRSEALQLLLVSMVVLTTGGVVLLSVHDFHEMREFFDED